MTKLMFCKLKDETTWTADDQPYGFQIGSNESPSEVAARIIRIYESSKAQAQSVFRTPIAVADETIYRVVDELEEISLFNSDLDAKGKAFEKFLGSVFRGEMGQYFTPRTVVKFVVDVLQPQPSDRVLDPACGSGGFLLYSLEHVQQAAKRRFHKDARSRLDYWKDWAFRGLFGIEVNDQISRVAMMGMILHEDGHTNIAFADGLESFQDLQRVNVELKPESFSVVMANPPFGAGIRRPTAKSAHKYLDDYVFGKGKSSQRAEVLFIERCLDFLEPGGRMGIVLPESVVNTPSMDGVRRYIEDRAFLDAVISLPVETFVASGANVKSSVLFLRKYTLHQRQRLERERHLALTDELKRREAERQKLMTGKKNAAAIQQFDAEVRDVAYAQIRARLTYPVFVAKADSVGISATGQTTPNELEAIATAYHAFRKTSPLGFAGGPK
jgi:type I restriction enzyme M protein